MLVVGAGFSGATVARVLAEAGHEVRVLEKRAHPGGNAFDEPDSAGVLVHRYGPHVFHTNSATVFGFLSRFTAWRAYEHRVLARVDGQPAADSDQPAHRQRPVRPGARRGRRRRVPGPRAR